MEKLRRLIRIGVGVCFLVGAGGGLAWLMATKPRPEPRNTAPSIPRVEVLAVEPVVFDAPIVGYGTIRPKRQVRVIPEVGGRLLKVHDLLAVGNLIPKGELLFEIDARIYDARVRQVEAEVRRLETELRRHQQTQVDLEKRLALARQQEELARRNLERDQRLHEEGTLPDPELELAQDRLLRQQDAVLTCESQLALVPLQSEETNALLETKRAQAEEARINLDKTRILCPFEARVDTVSAQEWQVVVASLAIATLTDMEALELAAGVDPGDLRWTDVRAFARVVGEDLGPPPEAIITWSLHHREYTWRGPVTRLERVDESTRTAQVVVEIRDVMKGLRLDSGQAGLPLSVGMFCKVEIPAEPLPDALVVPRSAVYDGEGVDASKFVYVFEPDGSRPDASEGRLGIRRVPVLRAVDDRVLVNFSGAPVATSEKPGEAQAVCELRPGDEIVISPLPRAVAGMPLCRRDYGSVVRSIISPPSESLLASR